MADLDERLPATPNELGAVRCPHCGISFKLTDTALWTGWRHRTCGGAIDIGQVGAEPIIADKARGLEYETVEAYLKTYSADEPPYDIGGIAHLLLAVIENLRSQYIDADAEVVREALGEENVRFLRGILDES